LVNIFKYFRCLVHRNKITKYFDMILSVEHWRGYDNSDLIYKTKEFSFQNNGKDYQLIFDTQSDKEVRIRKILLKSEENSIEVYNYSFTRSGSIFSFEDGVWFDKLEKYIRSF